MFGRNESHERKNSADITEFFPDAAPYTQQDRFANVGKDFAGLAATMAVLIGATAIAAVEIAGFVDMARNSLGR